MGAGDMTFRYSTWCSRATRARFFDRE
jgi:hypothetical protein